MFQAILALRWYLVVQAFGLIALPLCLRLFRYLPDRGYGVSKACGLLLAGWVFWLLTTLGWLHNTAGDSLVAMAIVAIAGLALHLANQLASQRLNQLTDQLANQPPWHIILLTEAVFALTFAAWCVVRAYMPRIETAGGEKWMEIAFLRAILRSDTFPPHDPWLSGFAISYYYFGYVIMAMLTRLAAIPPSIAFNLGIATLFALTCAGVFSVVSNLITAERKQHKGWGDRLAALAGLLGVVLVAVMGNLEALFEVLHARGIGSASFWQWLDIRALAEAPPVAFAEGSWSPSRFIWWWQASRVVRDYTLLGGHQEVIDEFPGFSFLLGDMHPHVLGLPFVLLALALALNLYLRVTDGKTRTWPLNGWEFPLYAICLGGLGFLNTWDFPIYLLVIVAAYLLAHLRTHHASRFTYHVLRSVLLSIALFVAGFLLYFPFWRSFQSQVGGTLPNLLNGTRLPQFVVMFGPLLLIAIAFVALEARRNGVSAGKVVEWTLSVLTGIVGVLVLLAALLVLLVWSGAIQPQGIASYVDAWLRGEPIPGLEEVPGLWTLVRRRLLLDPQLLGVSPEPSRWDVVLRAALASPAWVVLGLLAFLVAIVFVLKQSMAERQLMLGMRDFALLLFAVGALLALSVEFGYVKDHFGTRMNTIFKFYFQTWVLWGIAGAYALATFLRRGGARAFIALLPIGGTACLAVWLTDDAVRRFLLAAVRPPLPVLSYVAGFGLAWLILIAACACAVTVLVQRGGMAAAGVLTATALLIVAGLLFPALAIPKRAGECGGPPTLDGADYLSRSNPADYRAITWLNENVKDAPVILETPGGGYEYEGRVSAHTGLPTLLGWADHEWQWRGSLDEQDRRKLDIETIYASTDPVQVLTLLDEYGISYVYVGPLERTRYPAEGLPKFGELMKVVYDDDGVTIYKR